MQNIWSVAYVEAHTDDPVRNRGPFNPFVTWLHFYGMELLAICPAPMLKNHPLSAVRDCLFNIFAANLHTCRPFLHPQPDGAPCCGDRNSLNFHGKKVLTHGADGWAQDEKRVGLSVKSGSCGQLSLSWKQLQIWASNSNKYTNLQKGIGPHKTS
jgi:hypothetical protein